MENNYTEELRDLKRIYRRNLDALEGELTDNLHQLAKQMSKFLSVYERVHSFKTKHDVLLSKMEEDEIEEQQNEENDKCCGC